MRPQHCPRFCGHWKGLTQAACAGSRRHPFADACSRRVGDIALHFGASVVILNYYAGDVTRLSDEELAALRQEIEDSGVLTYEEDYQDFEDFSDEAGTTRQRYYDLGDELQRREWERDPEAYQEHLRYEARMAPITAMLRRKALEVLSRHMVFSKVGTEPPIKIAKPFGWYKS